ncbi:MAG: hypothetical protein E7616_04370 [Ruminococcaceae bacterium]|nr:hypothetical protein [Oscillospiraceae bacterium]
MKKIAKTISAWLLVLALSMACVGCQYVDTENSESVGGDQTDSYKKNIDESFATFRLPEEMPEDFRFSLIWGVYGISSYDSEIGALIKTTDAAHPENYTTTLHLSEEQMQQIYTLIRNLDVGSYPDLYNPFPEFGSDPPYTIVLTVYDGIGSKTIACRDIAIPGEEMSTSEESAEFISTYNAIRKILTDSEQWMALPDYETYYD